VIQTAPRTLIYLTGPDYLRAMGIALLQGRFFTPEDTVSSPCVVAIDSVLAQTYFPGKNPLGETLSGFGFEKPFVGPCRIVGVVGHVRSWGMDDRSPTRAQTYYPLYQDPDQWVPLNFADATLIVRTSLDPASALAMIKAVVYGVDRGQPVYDVETMQDIISRSMSSERFPMILLGIFASLALLLASVGIYGVVSYSVAQRMREIGIRLALGADKGKVLRLILGEGARMALLGIGVGIVSAIALARLMAGLLFGVSAHDPFTLFIVATLVILVALLASYIPARRALEVDPMVVLRHE